MKKRPSLTAGQLAKHRYVSIDDTERISEENCEREGSSDSILTSTYSVNNSMDSTPNKKLSSAAR